MPRMIECVLAQLETLAEDKDRHGVERILLKMHTREIRREIERLRSALQAIHDNPDSARIKAGDALADFPQLKEKSV